MPKLSVVLPCWKRENLTLQMINCVCMQTFDDFEIFVLGDHCKEFDKIITSNNFYYFKNILQNRLHYFNFEQHDGTSSQAINYAMKYSSGDWFIFLSNDDYLLNNHFENYVNLSEKNQSDICLFNTYVNYGDGILKTRFAKVELEKCGHSEMCVSKNVYKNAPLHTRNYGHDFEFLINALNMGYTYSLANNSPTYIVNSDLSRERSWG